MCVGGVPSKRRHRAFKRRLSYRDWSVLQNEAMGVRDGIVGAEAEREVLAMGPMPIMVRPMNQAGHGYAERVRRSR
jgi:hypothetical protein